MTLSRHVVTDPDELASMRGEWEQLLANSSANEPSLSPDWILAWWRVFGQLEGRRLRVLTVRNDGRLVGLIPMLTRVASHPPGISLRRLELVPSGEAEADEICSEYIGLIADRGHEFAVAQAFADAVADGELGRFGELVLPAMDGEQFAPAFVASALHRRGLSVNVTARHWSPYVPLPDSWDAYLEALAPSRRYRVRRSVRAFESWAKGPPTLTFAKSSSDLVRLRAVLERLHAERWSEAGKPGVFASERFRSFHDELIPALFERGALEIGSLDVRGEPVAAFYNFVWNGKSYFYQGGRKLDVPNQIRLGLVMHAAIIRNAIERGLREYDFLSGTSRYKVELALRARPIVSIRATRPSAAEAVRCAADLLIDQTRPFRRQLARATKKFRSLTSKEHRR
jgi:CelD/BcsL family acetyltransferase involved in cellulose biosynthesis